MSMIFRRDRLPVKPARNTPRPVGRFGAGLTYFVAAPVLAAGFTEPDPADRQWAAIHLNADSEPDWDQLAGEAAALDAMESLTPPPAGLCSSCGDWSDDLAFGLCEACFYDAETDASARSRTARRMVS